jgi:hypothetical protein
LEVSERYRGGKPGNSNDSSPKGILLWCHGKCNFFVAWSIACDFLGGNLQAKSSFEENRSLRRCLPNYIAGTPHPRLDEMSGVTRTLANIVGQRAYRQILANKQLIAQLTLELCCAQELPASKVILAQSINLSKHNNCG